MSKNDKKQQVETTGHEWDGIQEFNNPLPRWWVWVFYVTIGWGLWYTVAYPAWPLLTGATEGYKGFSTRGQVAADIAAVEAQNAPNNAALAASDLATLQTANPALYSYAVNAGGAVFRTNCVQCHGNEGMGATGYPTLSDDDWLWGGSVVDIAYTVSNGVRNESSPDARFSQMPAFGDILSNEEIANVVAYVRALSGQEADATAAAAGQQVFLDNCSACHGEDGKGDRMVGAPNLADALWLYGGDAATITQTVKNARFGVMPAWSEAFRDGGLTQAEVNAVAIYVHQLGGGE